MKLKLLISVSLLALIVSAGHARDLADTVAAAAAANAQTVAAVGEQVAWEGAGAVSGQVRSDVQSMINDARSNKTQLGAITQYSQQVDSQTNELGRLKGEEFYIQVDLKNLNEKYKGQEAVQAEIKSSQSLLDAKNKELNAATDPTTRNRLANEAGALQTKVLAAVDKAKASGLGEFQKKYDELRAVLVKKADAEVAIASAKTGITSTMAIIDAATKRINEAAIKVHTEGTKNYQAFINPPAAPISVLLGAVRSDPSMPLLAPVLAAPTANPNEEKLRQVTQQIMIVGGGKLTPDAMNQIVAAGGGNLSPEAVNRIVAAGGGNLNPQVRAAIVAVGGGNVLANDGASFIAAQIVAAGGGNLTPQGIALIVAAGGGNLTGQVLSAIVAAGGGNVLANDGASLIAARIVAAGGGNVLANDGASLLVIASIVAAGGGNVLANDGMGLIGNDPASLVRMTNLIGQDLAGLVTESGSTFKAARLVTESGSTLMGEIAHLSRDSGIRPMIDYNLDPPARMVETAASTLNPTDKRAFQNLVSAAKAGPLTTAQAQLASYYLAKIMKSMPPNEAQKVKAHAEVLVAQQEVRSTMTVAVAVGLPKDDPRVVAALNKMMSGAVMTAAETALVSNAMSKVSTALPMAPADQKRVAEIVSTEVKKANAIAAQPVFTLSNDQRLIVETYAKGAAASSSAADKQALLDVSSLVKRAAGPGLTQAEAAKLQGLLGSLSLNQKDISPAFKQLIVANASGVVPGSPQGESALTRAAKPAPNRLLVAVPAQVPTQASVNRATSGPANPATPPQASAAATPAAFALTRVQSDAVNKAALAASARASATDKQQLGDVASLATRAANQGLTPSEAVQLQGLLKSLSAGGANAGLKATIIVNASGGPGGALAKSSLGAVANTAAVQPPAKGPTVNPVQVNVQPVPSPVAVPVQASVNRTSSEQAKPGKSASTHSAKDTAVGRQRNNERAREKTVAPAKPTTRTTHTTASSPVKPPAKLIVIPATTRPVVPAGPRMCNGKPC